MHKTVHILNDRMIDDIFFIEKKRLAMATMYSLIELRRLINTHMYCKIT